MNDQSILSIDLTQFIVSETPTSITIKFPDKEAFTLNKYDWVNKDKIYDDGKTFFMVANKQLNTRFAQDRLARHAMGKVFDKIEDLYMNDAENAKDRIEYLFGFRKTLKKLILPNTLQLAS